MYKDYFFEKWGKNYCQQILLDIFNLCDNTAHKLKYWKLNGCSRSKEKF